MSHDGPHDRPKNVSNFKVKFIVSRSSTFIKYIFNSFEELLQNKKLLNTYLIIIDKGDDDIACLSFKN